MSGRKLETVAVNRNGRRVLINMSAHKGEELWEDKKEEKEEDKKEEKEVVPEPIPNPVVETPKKPVTASVVEPDTVDKAKGKKIVSKRSKAKK